MLPAPETRGYKLLIVDGHESHISLYAAQLAIANKLDIVLMPSHTSHLVQPLDVGVFCPLKMLSSAAMTKHSVSHLILPHDVPMIMMPIIGHLQERTSCLHSKRQACLLYVG